MRDRIFDALPGVPALAYLGDSVFETFVREKLVRSGIASSEELNESAQKYVTAVRQSEGALKILPLLSEDETEIFKRGRNHRSKAHPKSADIEEYRRATGIETLFGALYLTGSTDRIKQLIDLMFCEGESEK